MSAAERDAFAQRMRTQVQSRYSDAQVDIDADRFALRVTGPGMDSTLPLAPLFQATRRDSANTAALITQYMATLETHLTPKTFDTFAL